MKAKVHFKGIKETIIQEIKSAKSDIKIAVAWFTDEDIMTALKQAKNRGVEISIAISDCKENFISVGKLKGMVRVGIKLFVSSGKLLHHKFCLIDGCTIINGSYNWSYQASKNEENIIVITLDKDIKEDDRMILEFQTRHNYLCYKTSTYISNSDMLNVLKVSGSNALFFMAVTDENEIALRAQFEDDVKSVFEKSKAAKIPIGENLEERMIAEGGGVDFVNRILRDEMNSNAMKSGFQRLTEVIPHRVDLSLEYLASRKKYHSLFSEEAVNFCIKKMREYNLHDLS
jgi:hypothetical protein